jgi:hypothetical protein
MKRFLYTLVALIATLSFRVGGDECSLGKR